MSYRNLEYLASAHGLINPHPHQALSDVDVMLRIMDQYDFAKIERLAKEENIQLTCFTRPGEEEEIAKKLGFKCLKNDNAFNITIKPSQESEFKQYVRKYLPQAFDTTCRLIASLKFGQNEIAKAQGYKFHWESKTWYKNVLKADVFIEIDQVKHLFPVHIERNESLIA
jgi:hypothetical protein